MSNSIIKQQFEVSLENAVRDHLVGNRTGERQNWHWSLKPCKDGRQVIEKLRLVLSWRLGSQVVGMTPQEVLKHFIEQYKKLIMMVISQ